LLRDKKGNGSFFNVEVLKIGGNEKPILEGGVLTFLKAVLLFKGEKGLVEK